jgi:hypothetical protein
MKTDIGFLAAGLDGLLVGGIGRKGLRKTWLNPRNFFFISALTFPL